VRRISKKTARHVLRGYAEEEEVKFASRRKVSSLWRGLRVRIGRGGVYWKNFLQREQRGGRGRSWGLGTLRYGRWKGKKKNRQVICREVDLLEVEKLFREKKKVPGWLFLSVGPVKGNTGFSLGVKGGSLCEAGPFAGSQRKGRVYSSIREKTACGQGEKKKKVLAAHFKTQRKNLPVE